MRFWAFLKNLWWRWAGSDDQLAWAVVVACHSEVLNRVWKRACEMAPNEARGYVWARAAQPVDRMTTQVLREAGLNQKRRSQVVLRATELLVGGVLDELSDFQPRQSTRVVNKAA